MVVPEELNLLDFSNIAVHINVKRMLCIWFEGSSENRHSMLCQLDVGLHRTIASVVSPNNGCCCLFSEHALNDLIHIEGRVKTHMYL